MLALWVGLGYNRRAVNLWRAARAAVERHDGRLPDELAALLALPGIGPYTARAVLAFAFEADVGVVDTNVGRVLARRAGRPLRPRQVQAAADAAVPPGGGWAHNQAMLDLGATVCTARAPACDACPVRAGCAWAAAGRPAPDPAVGSAGVSTGPVPLRGLRPPGPGTPGGRPAWPARWPAAPWPRSWAGPTTRPGPPGWRAAWWPRGSPGCGPAGYALP